MKELSASIFMPAYNAEDTILDSLGSLSIKSHPEKTFYVINDGSTDKTVELLKSIKEKNFHVLDLGANYGLEYVYNKIFDISRTDLTLIYHADDTYEPSIINKSIQFMRHNAEVGVCFAMSENHFRYAPLKFHSLQASSLVYDKSELMLDLSRYYNFILTPSACVRTKTIIENNIKWGNKSLEGKLSQGSSGGDLQFWLELSEVSTIGFLNEFLLNWKQHENQLSRRSKKGLKTVSDFIPVMELHNLTEKSLKVKNKVKNNLTLVKYKEFVIAKLNCIIDGDTTNLRIINRNLAKILPKFLKQLILQRWAINKYFKYFILYILISIFPGWLSKKPFIKIKEKYFNEY